MNILLTSSAAALLALFIQVGDGKKFKNGQIIIPEGQTIQQVERQGIGSRIGQGIQSLLAKGVDFVIPSAHANPFAKAAEEGGWAERGAQAREQMGEQTQRTQQAEAEAQQAEAELQQVRLKRVQAEEELRQNEQRRIDGANRMIYLVGLLGIEFEGELEEKWNEMVKYGAQENLSIEKVDELIGYLRDIGEYIDANY